MYTRQSFDRQGEGAAVARQLEDCRRLADLRGWPIVVEHQDNDRSAAGTTTRPGFEALLSDVAAGRAGAVIAWNLDRLTRNRRDTVRLIETCQEAGATIAVVRGSDLDMSTPAGRMTADLLAAVARNEIETKSDRQRRANLQRAQAGKPPQGRRAFRYTADGMTILDAEANLIRAGYDVLLAGGSLSSIARTWNAAGVATTADGRWNTSNVRRLLASPRYAAVRIHRGEVLGPGTWPAVVEESTWRAAVALLTDPARSTVKDRSIKYTLTRIATCAKCGAKMATGRTQHGVRTYQCSGAKHLSVKAADVDEYVHALVVARLARPDAAELVRPSSNVDVPALRTEANALRGRLDEGARLFADGTITGAQLARINGDVEAALEVVERKIAAAGERDVLARFVGADDVAALWGRLDVLTQRAVIDALFSGIVLHSPGRGARNFRPECVEVLWR
ncbi:recombinase family protein [Georgenia faecalis]|uniref:Recombinase family protein n=1 Tax=Georgenia faecalis TaxID=2483799 RepID=A0ABV9D659_9MICO|nr:recombinase family protein [Georgenia faecalis]